MRGLMAKPDGSIIETPITANFREGLNVLQYFISTHGARKGLADTALKTANSGYLTRRLVDVTQDLVVTEDDCGTTNGVAMKALVEGGEVIEALRDRILGRVATVDVVDPETQETLYEAGTLLDEDAVDTIEAKGIDEVRVRTPLTCETRYGLCAKCYGRDLGRGVLVNSGEAVGVIAAQSIGEPGTQLTMRTFHIGGAASRAAVASSGRSQVQRHGALHRHDALRHQRQGRADRHLALRRSHHHRRQRPRARAPQGALRRHAAGQLDGKQVKAGVALATWDPLTRPIITEYSGTVKFEHVEEGVTVAKQIDEVTGLSTLVVIDAKRRGTARHQVAVRPQVKLLDAAGEEVKIAGTDHSVTITFPVGALITVRDGQEAGVGEVLARIPTESSEDPGHHRRSAAGGRAVRGAFAEGRRHAGGSHRHRVVRQGHQGQAAPGHHRHGRQRPRVPDPKDKNVLVHDGQVVNKGELIVDGPADPHDILRLLGIEALARYIVDEVQDVYRLQGVKINDKHIEVIVRQMLRRVQISRSGRHASSSPASRSSAPRSSTRTTSAASENKREAVHINLLLGITKASLSTDSFISAASFQETTRVLTEAAIMGKKDDLRGLKENVIVGRLIPAGTGLAFHRARRVKEELEAQEQAMLAAQAQSNAMAEAEALFAAPEPSSADEGSQQPTEGAEG